MFSKIEVTWVWEQATERRALCSVVVSTLLITLFPFCRFYSLLISLTPFSGFQALLNALTPLPGFHIE